MTDYDDFTLKLLTDMGFDTDAKRTFRVAVLQKLHDANNRILDAAWDLQDGYGEAGLTPPQGWDWSGIRDSSYGAMAAIGALVGLQAPGTTWVVRLGETFFHYYLRDHMTRKRQDHWTQDEAKAFRFLTATKAKAVAKRYAGSQIEVR